jgi:hypothetical protein
MRHALPFRPANVQVNNFGFGNAIYPSVPYPDVTVTWSNRNRLTEDTVFPPLWNAATVTPEAGQTTRIVLRSPQGVVLQTYDDLTGTSYTIPKADIGTPGAAWVEVYGKRGPLTSLQFARRYVRFGVPSGWNYDWGEDWSGPLLWENGDAAEPLWYADDDEERFL